ncbi:chemotaxis protein [Vibrio hepatarius]|uniref:chemotaxis protein n=1 Tax=Vibrio hepatarius TaxID=171383 RepID=UPI00373559CD
MTRKQLFVVAAEVAAELNRGVIVAKQLKLVASNARALALRAGGSAAGFHPITDSIDELVNLTLEVSNSINTKAQHLSHIATSSVRSYSVLKHFEAVYQRSQDAQFIHSLDAAHNRCQQETMRLDQSFSQGSDELNHMLNSLYDELRVALIISTLLSVEASQVEEQFKGQLNTIAENVQQAAESIREHVLQSLQLFSHFDKERHEIKSAI